MNEIEKKMIKNKEEQISQLKDEIRVLREAMPTYVAQTASTTTKHHQ